MKLKLVLVTVFLVGVGMIAFTASLPKPPAPTVTPAAVTAQVDSLRYVSYDPQRFAQLAHQRRVLFFRASWCSTCAEADKELSAQSAEIPSNITVFEVDYDREKELKQKYAVVNQHTFVQVDNNGELVALWNGGGLEELLANTQ